MLKNLKINGKNVPVVVPLSCLGDVYDWLEKNLTKNDETITKFFLNGQGFSLDDSFEWKSLKIKKSDLIEVNTDSAKNLSLEILDALFDLSVGLDKKAQKVAIAFWRGPILIDFKEFKLVMEDLNLLLDLVHHINSMLDYSHYDMAAFNANSVLIKRVLCHLEKAFKEKDWKLCSRLFVGRLEPLLNVFVNECDFVKLRVMDALPTSESFSNCQILNVCL